MFEPVFQKGQKVLVRGRQLTQWTAEATVETFEFDPHGCVKITFSEYVVTESLADLSSGIVHECQYCEQLLVSPLEVSYLFLGDYICITPIDDS